MKIRINDLEHVLKQIRNIVNPTTKEHNKILNTLKIFLEDNTDVQDPAVINVKQDVLLSKFYELSKIRRESPKELNEEFKVFCCKIKKLLESTRLNEKQEVVDVEHEPINCSYVFDDIKKLNKESIEISERMDVLTSGLSTKGIKKSNNDKTIINYFKTL